MYHEDPQAKLIPSDSQWNEIVMKNKADYEKENLMRKADRFNKNKAIQQEQLEQIRRTRDRMAAARNTDR